MARKQVTWPHDFTKVIEEIGRKSAEDYRFDDKTTKLISSFLNDILKNVTLKAKENVEKKNANSIRYADVMMAAMDQFGEENKWIERIVTRNQSKLDFFEQKVRYIAPQNGDDEESVESK